MNPAAGRAGSRRFARVVAALRRAGCCVVIRHAGPAPGDTERLAREAEAEFDVIVAAGGDGTINAVANGMRATPRPLAILPLGTANVLGYEIALPRRPKALAAVIAAADARPVWPGRIGDRLFLTMAGAGFDAEVVEAVNASLKRRIGKLAVVWAILESLCRYRRCELSAEIDGVGYRAASVVIAKARHYAGRFVLAPEACIGAPSFQVLLFQRAGRIAAVRYLAAMVVGRVHLLSDVRIIGAREVRLEAETPAAVQADGELVARLPATIAIADAPLLLVQPTPSSEGRRKDACSQSARGRKRLADFTSG
jgi:diacylglycerol kinase (ATP)